MANFRIYYHNKYNTSEFLGNIYEVSYLLAGCETKEGAKNYYDNLKKYLTNGTLEVFAKNCDIMALWCDGEEVKAWD